MAIRTTRVTELFFQLLSDIRAESSIQSSLPEVELEQDLRNRITIGDRNEPAVDSLFHLKGDSTCFRGNDRDSLQDGFRDFDFESFPCGKLGRTPGTLHEHAEKRVRGRSSDDRNVLSDELILFRVDDLRDRDETKGGGGSR